MARPAAALWDPPWKHSRYSSRCPALLACTMETGKLLDEEANTAGAKEWSFLSRNSVKAGQVGLQGQSRGCPPSAGPEPSGVGRRTEGGSHTVKRVLLHINLIEFVGSNEDTVIGEVDTAAGLRGLYLLRRGAQRDRDDTGPKFLLLCLCLKL